MRVQDFDSVINCVKDFISSKPRVYGNYVLTTSCRVYGIDEANSLRLSDDILGFIKVSDTQNMVKTLVPFFYNIPFLVSTYLSTLRITVSERPFMIFAPNAKIDILALFYKNRLVFELTNIHSSSHELNLPTILMRRAYNIIFDTTKHELPYRIWRRVCTEIEKKKIIDNLSIKEARGIMYRYYYSKKITAEERKKVIPLVMKIINRYEEIFRPKRVIYDINTFQVIL